MAFELMASGRYASAEQVRDRLTDAGLRMPSGQPISMQTIHKLLRDKYYMGVITYKGMEYPGHHEPLVTEELFARVQRIMDSHQGAGTRTRTHHHYLKGVIWCARCKQRFMVQRTRNRHDPTGEYYYFFCGGREDKTCDQPYIAVEAIEQAIEDHYAVAAWLPPAFRAQVRAAVDAAVLSNYELTDELREQYTKRLSTLERKESYLLDLAAEEGWPKDVLRSKVASIRQERDQLQSQLDHAEQQLDTGRSVFLLAATLFAHDSAGLGGHDSAWLGVDGLGVVRGRLPVVAGGPWCGGVVGWG